MIDTKRAVADKWMDYKVIASGGGQKLERFGSVILLRPDPQVIWPSAFDLSSYKGLNATYVRSDKGGGGWEMLIPFKNEWTISYNGTSVKKISFYLQPMGFKHLGVFPEQAANWEVITELIKRVQTNGNCSRSAQAGQEIRVLNLFAYTGGASLAAATAGARVTHVDAAKGMVERAQRNAKLSGIDSIRFIVDDCFKFVAREIKRGVKYDGIIMDPPSFGRGPKGEMWKIEDDLFSLVKRSREILSERPLFFLISSYTTGLQPIVVENILRIALSGLGGEFNGYELALPTDEGIKLPCGASGLWSGGCGVSSEKAK